MTRRKYIEDFFVKHSKEIFVNPDLPFKLQKRELLKKLGFPLDNNVLISPQRQQEIKRVFKEYLKHLPFLIGVHLKPMNTYRTPFFLIEREKISYYDEFGNRRFVTQEEIFHEIKTFIPHLCWIEFVKSIWAPSTIAGRLVYISSIEQIIEIQKGIISKELGNERNKYPYLCLNLNFFNVNFKENKYTHLLLNSGFERAEVDDIIFSLRKHRREFEILERIAALPTLEFGYLKDRKLIVIDVDWPSQYQTQ